VIARWLDERRVPFVCFLPDILFPTTLPGCRHGNQYAPRLNESNYIGSTHCFRPWPAPLDVMPYYLIEGTRSSSPVMPKYVQSHVIKRWSIEVSSWVEVVPVRPVVLSEAFTSSNGFALVRGRPFGVSSGVPSTNTPQFMTPTEGRANRLDVHGNVQSSLTPNCHDHDDRGRTSTVSAS